MQQYCAQRVSDPRGESWVKFRELGWPRQPSVARVARATAETAPTWLVSGADGTRPNRVERFSGTDAMVRSLRFAHDEFSRVRWLMN